MSIRNRFNYPRLIIEFREFHTAALSPRDRRRSKITKGSKSLGYARFPKKNVIKAVIFLRYYSIVSNKLFDSTICGPSKTFDLWNRLFTVKT